MSTRQGSQVLNSLRISGWVALGLGLLYAAFMTAREYAANSGAGPNLVAVFAVSLLYCAVPLFTLIFISIGVAAAVRSRGGTQG